MKGTRRETQTQEAEAGKGAGEGGREDPMERHAETEQETRARDTEGQSTTEPKSQGPSHKENRES